MSVRGPATAGLAVLLGIGCGGAEPVARRATQPEPHELRVLDATLDASRWLAASARVAGAAGAGPLQSVAAAVGAEGDRVGGFVELGAAECVLAIARPGPSVSDLDLFVFSDGGDLLAADESPSPEASVLVCPPHPARMYVSARVVAGTGIVAVGAMPVGPAAAQAVARAVQVRGQPGQDTGKLEAWPGLEAKIRDRRRSLGASWEDVRRTMLPVEPRSVTTLSLGIGAERCVDVLVAPGEDVHGIDLSVADDKARVVARADAPGRDRALTLCAHQPQSITLQIRSLSSSGAVAVVVAQAPVGARSELRDARMIDPIEPSGTVAEATVRLRERTGSLRLGLPKRLGGSSAGSNGATSLPLRLGEGCARVDVVAGAPLRGLHAALWTDQGQLLGSTGGNESAALFRCGPAGQAEVEVEATEHPGPFVVEWREDPRPPPPALQLPLAAGRLLGRLEASRGPVDPQLLAAAQVVALVSTGRRVVPVSVAAGRCLEIVAALDGDLRGLELRLADDSSGQVTESSGDAVASGTLCAGSEPKRGRIELRSTRGEARGLLIQLASEPKPRGEPR